MPELTLNHIASLCRGRLMNALGTEPCTSIVSSSGDARPGAIFVAIRGHAADAHAYVPQAFAGGATAAVVEDDSALGGRPGVVVTNSRSALSRLAAAFFDEPSSKLSVIGITGTNGKTTTNWIVYHALNQLGMGALRIGTLGSECMGRDCKSGALTSPDPISVHRMLAEAAAAGAKACVMETSSHALDQARIDDVQFDAAVFTNLTRDHLDYHETFERYFAAKSRLFELLVSGPKKQRVAVINVDDEFGWKMRQRCIAEGVRDWSFGTHPDAAVRIDSVTETDRGMDLELSLREIGVSLDLSLPFIGMHNAENAAAAFAVCAGLGSDLEALATVLESVPQVPGRLEAVGNGSPRVFVDYAHTPDALERAIKAIRPSTKGALWVVFGCGGDRDRGKRPEMARIADAHADRVVVTSDNPRTEDPEAIISDILASGIKARIVEPDRAAAIHAAVGRASNGDTVLIAGKGHEDYQIIGTAKVSFSDQKVAHEALARRGSRS